MRRDPDPHYRHRFPAELIAHAVGSTVQHYLWRAVDQEGVVLDILVQSRRNTLMAACSIAKSDIWTTTRVNLWFIGVLLLVLLLCTHVPAVSPGLVNLFYGA